MKIQQIRNATLKIQYGGTTFLLDPWLQDKGMGFSAKAVRPEMQGVKCPLCALPLPVENILDGVDYCLVTHLHPDHFTADYLPKTVHILVQNKADAATVESLGFTNVSVIGDHGMEIGSVLIEKTDALHGDNPQLAAKMGAVSGYFLTGEDKALYIAGDTVFCDGVEKILKTRKPEVILLNCCAATIPAGRLIMDEHDLESVRTLCPQSVILATHLDSVNHALLDSEDIRRFAAERQLQNVHVLKNGESLQL